MYTHILVPVAPDHEGRGEAALSAAEALLDDDGRITLIYVQEIVPAYVASYVSQVVFDNNRKEMKQKLTELAQRTSAQVEIALVDGQPARALVEYGASHQVDCIVIASHHPGLVDYFLGSTSGWVARHADCSVHIIR